MNIAMVMAGNEEGGLEKHVEELVAGLAGKGHEVTWIGHPKYALRVGGTARFQPVDLSMSRRNPLAIWRLWRILNRLQPDVVHAQANKALTMVSTVKPFLSGRLITTIHNQKKRHAGIESSDAVIAVSQDIAGRITHPNVTVVYNGINIDEPVRNQNSNHNRTLHVIDDKNTDIWLGIGRLVKAKGFDILIEAMQGVSGSLFIAGEGPERKSLESQIAKLGLRSRVFLLGQRDDIPELMRQCHSLVISSRREGFSYVFAEALLNSCPVLSTDVPIPNEVMPQYLLCPTGNAGALAQLMNGFKPDQELIDSLADYATSHLTLDSMIKATIAVYEAALARRPS